MIAVKKSGLRETNWSAAAALVCGVVFAVFIFDRPRPPRAEIDGYVYHQCKTGGVLVGPVSGALVSTSVDSATVATDSTGHFGLRTETRVPDDQFYTLTVRADGSVVNGRLLGSRATDLAITFSPPWQGPGSCGNLR